MTLQLVDEDLSRATVILRIKGALERRSGKRWSVTGGTGTAYGWLRIDAPPVRRTWSQLPKAGTAGDWPDDFEWIDLGEPGPWRMTGPEDRTELARLLSMDSVDADGVQVAASHAYYREYIDRAEGREPRKIATPYWD